MSTVCELAFSAQRAAEMTELITGSIQYWQDLPELETLDLYMPAAASGADPYVDDGPAPACLALQGFPSFEALDRAAHHARFKTGLRVLGTDVLTCTAMQRSEHAVAGTERPAPLTASFSYVVRYHRPVEDEAVFVRHYLDTHPSLLARLPWIRNVLCYVPLAWRHPAGISVADYMLGN